MNAQSFFVPALVVALGLGGRIVSPVLIQAQAQQQPPSQTPATPETPQAGTPQTPPATQPTPQPPGTPAPGTQAPGSAAPGTPAPGTAVPGGVIPGTQIPLAPPAPGTQPAAAPPPPLITPLPAPVPSCSVQNADAISRLGRIQQLLGKQQGDDGKSLKAAGKVTLNRADVDEALAELQMLKIMLQR